jgi:MFS family permease
MPLMKPEKAPLHIPKKLYVILFGESIVMLAMAGLLLNMLELSEIIWADGKFHPLEMGIIIACKTWGMAISGIFIGRLADRLSRRFLFVFVFSLMGTARIANGFAPAGDPNCMYYFMIYYLLAGMGQGGVQPLISSFTNDLLPSDERSHFFGVLESVRQFSQIVGMLSGAWLIQNGYWQDFFWATGIMLSIGAILMAFVLQEPKRGQSHHALGEVLRANGVNYEYKLNRETWRSTVFSPTNIIAFIEGIFTWILFSIAMYMLYPYIQSPPYNISPFMSSILMVIFGMPGVVFGAIVFGRLSDRVGKQNIQMRINLIVFAIVTLYISVLLVFIVPLPEISPEEGDSIQLIANYPIIFVFGVLIFVIRGVLGIYHVNQTPIIQKLNLPEAQGTVTSWNQFLETIGFGLGPVIAGYLLTIYAENYFIVALISISIGIPGAFLWLLAKRFIVQDVNRVDAILTNRAHELKNSTLDSD